MFPNLSNYTVLIVDDDEPSLLLLKELIETTNALILTSDCGNGTLEIIKSKAIDLILLDIQLGDISGCILLPDIRKISPSTYVIAQTAFAMNNHREYFIEKGFDDYISKPLQINDLSNILTKFLNSRLEVGLV